MDKNTAQRLIDYLSQYVTEPRKKKINALLDQRTRYITTVLEDLYQSHNMGAIFRSCEGLGVQDIHYISGKNQLNVNNAIAAGSGKWLDVFQYSDQNNLISPLESCIAQLKKQGYSIVATSPYATMPLEALPLDKKIAFFFGTELDGLTQEAVDSADQLVSIPMYGFTESFNVSVSVSLCLYDSITRLKKSSLDWGLTQDEKLYLKLDWMRNSVENADALERRFFHEHPQLEKD